MIAEFYENCEVFVTGGSGTLGKAVIEKLLRSCNVKKVYVLLRSKRGVAADERLKRLKNSKIFRVLSEVKPNEIDKLVAVSGDITLDGFGLSDQQKQMLSNVSIVIHSAAITHFNAAIKDAIRLNVKSTLTALKLAEQMRYLKIFLYISTFFCNPYVPVFEDKVYPPLFGWRTAIKMLDDNKSDDVLDAITSKIITGFFNTYLFTKHLAEQVVDEYRTKLPVAIYRPSIVFCSQEEPEPGYIESTVGLMGLLALWTTGPAQILYMKSVDFRLDWIPLDVCVKTLLMFAALRGQLPRERFIESTPVGQFSSSYLMDMSFPDHTYAIKGVASQYPSEKHIWIENSDVTHSKLLFYLRIIFQQILPSMLIDLVARLRGKSTSLMKFQRVIWATTVAVTFVFDEEYKFTGMTDLEKMLAIGNGTEFNINCILDVRKREERDRTVKLMWLGIRKYILGEDETSIERCRQILKWKMVIYNTLKVLLGLLVFYKIVCSITVYI